MKDRQQASRRDFVIGASSLALAAGLGGCSDSGGGGADGGAADTGGGSDSGGADAARPAVPAGRVVEVHDARAVSNKVIDAARVRAMLEAGLTALAGVSTLKQAWGVLLPDFKPSMRIGLKVNTLNFRVATHPEVVAALVGTLTRDLGAAASRVWVWDRMAAELTSAGLTDKTVGGALIKASDTRGGGQNGYEAVRLEVKDRYTRPALIMTQDTDLTINLPVLKTHDIGGITGAFKNLYGCIRNPATFHKGFADYAHAIYATPPFARHFRLTINDGLFGIIKRFGPGGPADMITNRLLLSVDPVAVDAHAVALINQLRGTQSPLPGGMLGWLANAEAAKLGTTKVKLKKVTL